MNTKDLRQQLASIAASLPSGGSVIFTRADLLEMLEQEAPLVSGSAAETPDLTVTKVAELFGKSPNTVRDWVKHRGLAAYLFNGKEYRIPSAELNRWLAEQREKKRDAPARPRSGKMDLGSWRRHVQQ